MNNAELYELIKEQAERLGAMVRPRTGGCDQERRYR